jgi:hypothetical protein
VLDVVDDSDIDDDGATIARRGMLTKPKSKFKGKTALNVSDSSDDSEEVRTTKPSLKQANGRRGVAFSTEFSEVSYTDQDLSNRYGGVSEDEAENEELSGQGQGGEDMRFPLTKGLSYLTSCRAEAKEEKARLQAINKAVGNFVESTIPPVFLRSNKSGWSRFLIAIYRQHNWVRCFTYPSRRLLRSIRFWYY